MASQDLKDQIREFWNHQACGASHTKQEKFSLEYFEEIEEFRYKNEPEIFAFAQFTRASGKKVLEVGVGAGTDFIQWVRAGAKAYGVDFTQEAVEHVKKRLELYKLEAHSVQVADAENLPFQENSFDWVYSMGVVHHTPDTRKAIQEICRVCKPMGEIKIMVYHRHSVLAYMHWFSQAFLRGKFYRGLKWVLHHKMESIGTKAYTVGELKNMIADLPVEIISLESKLSFHDYSSNYLVLRLVRKVLCRILGDGFGWYLNIHLRKK